MSPSKLDARLFWAEFRGLTVLLEPNPIPGSGRKTPTETDVYRALGESAVAIEQHLSETGESFRALPWWTYHVTLCDLINEGQTGKLATRSDEVGEVLRSLPEAVAETNLLEPDTWGLQAHGAVSFSLGTAVREGNALVVNLEAIDGAQLVAVERVRSEIAHRLFDLTGLESADWRPHLTLGYWTAGSAPRAGVDLTSFLPQLRNPITYDASALYGFVDMVTFWRIGSPTAEAATSTGRSSQP